jgi:type VI secretion system secreted protein VgrG
VTEPAQPLAETYRLVLPESPAVAFDVVEVDLRDALDDLFWLEVRVHTRVADLSPRDFVGTRMVLEMPSFAGPLRVDGVVARMRQEWAEPTGVSRYCLVAVPWLWLTTQRRNSRIFQEQSAIELIHTIVGDHGERIPPCLEHLGRDYPVRDYASQYGESDWDMIRRTAADLGVALCARHDGSGAVAITDDPVAFGARAAEPIPFVPQTELLHAGPHVVAASFETRLAASRAHSVDYDHEHPLLALDARAFEAEPLRSEGTLEAFEFAVGRFADADAGTALGALRLEEQRSERERAQFHTSRPVAAGTVFTLNGHPRGDANGDWLVVRSRTRAADAEASHHVEAVPADLPYRPRRRPAPRIIGTQTAVVVGKDGEEIDVDEEGRVCVRFRWDRRDKPFDTTRRVRVSQGWAGPGYGFVCLPRVGDEVILDFLDGDPDQPLVVGRVHNGTNPIPQQLPEQKAWSTWRSRSTPGGEGFNEITLDDAAGAERIYVHAQRDANIDVENDVNAHVKGHVNGLVKGNSTGGVFGNGKLSIKGDAHLRVGGDLKVEAANITETADGNVLLHAGEQRIDESSRHFVQTGALYVNAGVAAQFVASNFVVYAGNITLCAGASIIHLSNGGIEITSDGPVKINGSVIKLN